MIVAWGWLALALGSALLQDDRARRRAAAGLVCLGLGLAAWRVSSTGPGGQLASPDRFVEGFRVGNAALLLLGLGLVIWAAASGAGSGRARVAVVLASGLGAAMVARLATGFVLAAGPIRAVASAALLGLTATALAMCGRAIASLGPVQALGRSLFREPRQWVPVEGPSRRRAAGGMVAGSVAAALGPHVGFVFLGVMAAAWSAYFLFHPVGRRPLPVSPLLTLLLVPTYWLLATIAGPVGLSLDALPTVPLSPAAEWVVAAALLLVAWAVAGLWPLHRQLPGALTGPVGALLLVRIALVLAPGGLESWRALAVPALIAGLWHAAARGLWPLAAVASAFLGIVGLTSVGIGGAGWLLGAALAVEIGSLVRLRDGLSRVAQAGAWIAAVWGALLVLEGGLRGEVVYTTLGAAGFALIVVSRVDSSPGRVHIWPDKAS